MKITKTQLEDADVLPEAKRECIEWFLRRFPSGNAEYQDVLDALGTSNRHSDASWIMDYIGPDPQAVMTVESIFSEHCFAAGRLIVRNGIFVRGQLRVGWSVEAGQDIVAGGHIRANSIEADGDIKAGGTIASGSWVRSGGMISADREIRAIGDIRADGSIKAGWSIKTQGMVLAGDGFGVFAGVSVSVDNWATHGQVVSINKPARLFSGLAVEYPIRKENP